jgi:sugar (pentulose or hexulose) kinase
MKPPYLLAIDNGTQSVRALLFDLQGELIDKAQVSITSYQTPQPGWLENDPDAFWQSLCQACQQLWASRRVAQGDIAAVVITTQRGTTVSLDRHGQPLRPSMIWLDQRRASQTPALSWWWKTALRSIGMFETVRYFQSEAEANWLLSTSPTCGHKPTSSCCCLAT